MFSTKTNRCVLFKGFGYEEKGSLDLTKEPFFLKKSTFEQRPQYQKHRS